MSKFDKLCEEILSEGGKELDYMLLSRMEMDNKYFLTSPHIKHLYMGNVSDQIKEMKKLWKKVKEKPEWLSWEDILDYEKKMKKVEKKLK